ncbi:MAG: 16S rRNA (cytosine(1402)-N(4))-methyltransferase RsmH [Alphaproteobacteria bacterium]|nr:16S rRNA (cytosine(1402)-N(4))-methyltransferase RsmH [Alphaproteobacteria bacterium]
MTEMGHVPVLLPEVLEALAPCAGETYVDGTFGGGGYARRVLAAAECTVYGIDRDLDAIARAEKMAQAEPRLIPLMGRFGDMDALLLNSGVSHVHGVMLDIGVSSFQIDQGERGFSFMRDGALDMRMGQSGPSAADVVNHMPEAGLAAVLKQLGEERQARRIAKFICDRRAITPFRTTLDLAETIEQAVGGRRGRKTHPATLSFQAIRMYVNDELGELARGLAAAERMLLPGGRLVVVTFHSLEDRLVKRFMRTRSGVTSGGSRYLPEKLSGPAPSFDLEQRKAIEASETELEANPRARSARLRVVIRTDADPWREPVDTGTDLPPLDKLELAV